MSTSARWYDAHIPGRPTPPGSTYTVLFDFIQEGLAAEFRAIAKEAPEELFETGRRVAPGYSRLNLLRYLRPTDERLAFIEQAASTMAARIRGSELEDCWLLRYLAGAGIREHVDPVPGRDAADYTRYRLNVLLTPEAGSGNLFVEGRQVGMRQYDAALFSSGSLIHAVEPAPELRLVLSLGMLAPKETRP